MPPRGPESFKPVFTPPPEDPYTTEPTVDVITSEEREQWARDAERAAMRSTEGKARREAQFHAAKLENTEQNFARTIERGDLVTAFDQIAYLATHGGAPETVAAMEQTFAMRIKTERSRLHSRTDFAIASGHHGEPAYDQAATLRQRQEQFLSLYEDAITHKQYNTPVRFELTPDDMERHARTRGMMPSEIASEQTETDTDPTRRKERAAAVQREILPAIMARATADRIDVLAALDALQTARDTAPSLYPQLRSQLLERLSTEIQRLRAKEALATQPIRRAIAAIGSSVRQYLRRQPEVPETYTYQQLEEVSTLVAQDKQPFETVH